MGKAIQTVDVRRLWEVMKEQYQAHNPLLERDYFIGFSHACSLTGVIDPFEWYTVQVMTAHRSAAAKIS